MAKHINGNERVNRIEMNISTITIQQLHKLIDIVNPDEYEIVYKLLTKFISEAKPFLDEIEVIKRLDNAIIKEETVNYNDIDWN